MIKNEARIEGGALPENKEAKDSLGLLLCRLKASLSRNGYGAPSQQLNRGAR